VANYLTKQLLEDTVFPEKLPVAQLVKKIGSLLWNPKAQCRVHKSLPPLLRQTNINIILPFTPRPPKNLLEETATGAFLKISSTEY
jgi:hypothetical protein